MNFTPFWEKSNPSESLDDKYMDSDLRDLRGQSVGENDLFQKDDVYEDIENDFYQEASISIDKITDGRIPESQKEQILDELLNILRKRTDNFSSSVPTRNNEIVNPFSFADSTNFNQSKPCINLILTIPSANSSYPQNYAYLQQPMMPMAQNPYFQMPQNQQPQLLQQPGYYYGGQVPYQTLETTSKPGKSKHKSHKDNSKSKHSSHKHKDKSKSKSKKSSKDSGEVIKLKYTPGNDFNGIIHYLTNKTHGNIHDNGTIQVTSDCSGSSGHPKNLLHPEGREIYNSNGSTTAWVCFDFKDMKVKLSNYTIKSCHWSKNIGHIRSWVIEVSDDNSSWTTIDQHTDCQDLNGTYLIKTYEVQPNKYSRYIRFRHTGSIWGGCPYGFKAMEFYGNLKMKSKK